MTIMVCFFVALKFSPFLKLQSLEIVLLMSMMTLQH